jgi:hypothetical protein
LWAAPEDDAQALLVADPVASPSILTAKATGVERIVASAASIDDTMIGNYAASAAVRSWPQPRSVPTADPAIGTVLDPVDIRIARISAVFGRDRDGR